MNQNKSIVAAVLFFGALWGFIEATLGYLLHLIPGGISGFLLYPIGLALMLSARRVTDKQETIFFVAVVAAAIKLADFFIPGAAASPHRILNPAVAILLEGLVSFAIISATARSLRKPAILIGTAAALSFSWRLLHLGALLLLPWEGILGRGREAVLEFIFLKGAVSGLLLVPVLFLHQRSLTKKQDGMPAEKRKPRVRLTTGFATFCVAVAVAAEILVTRFG